MNFSQFLLILRARRKIILLTLAVTVIATLAISLIMPSTYKASTTVVLNYKGTDPVTGFSLPAQLMPGYMATQVDIIKSMGVSLKVVDDLNLVDAAAVKEKFIEATKGKGSIREWKAALLLKKLDVVPSRESSFLVINFSDSNAEFASVVANAFANAYLHTSNQLKVDPSKKAAVYFNDQIKLLRENFEVAQERVSAYQQENGIVNADNRLDVETNRLNELSTQLVAAQTQMMDASSRKSQSEGAGGEDSPDVMSNLLIQNLKTQLAQADLRLTGLAQRFTKNHPHYQEAKAEVDNLRASLNKATRSMSNSISGNARILQQKEADIRAALAAQKAKVLSLNRMRDELRVLNNEMENAQRAYATTAQRFTQINLEGQSNQSDIAVLTKAVPPMEPAAPKMVLNLLLSIFLGLLMGLGFGMLAELLDRRVRSENDLMEVMQAPVLGVIEWKTPERPRVGLSTLLLSH